MDQQQIRTYQQIKQVIVFLEENFREQPGLDEVAANVGLSRFHLGRLFKDWAGITPTQFVRFLTLDYARTQLARSRSLLETAHSAGLSGPSRLHDLFVTFEAMTPGEYKQQGSNLHIRYSLAPCPFGVCLLARTKRGICHLSFLSEEELKEPLLDLQSRWPKATLIGDSKAGQLLINKIFTTESTRETAAAKRPFHLMLRGSNFQIQVWQALLTLPAATLISYQNLAHLCGCPRSTRAVAGAVAKNPIAWLIPCHRVIRKSGQIHNYRWGRHRKQAILAWEGAQNNAKTPIS
ncbi:MAG: methylated-DNA--[protein]-cysteine S-methyltransferase [Desulfobulbaceae bacterium]|uniref:methylated-DNA--[protein]-cysteine S-methyltransferase n=1 Tax=Candidatus Desulfatifera sulfidica TaxID=2841691 RepID=A0A8J6N8J5_9BACT|nr:methylated-DNA--[protein]-cysteine S-methyltransferase [Candidatus Desulfatifera sulfidica]